MLLKQLEYFAAVVDCQSFTKAAKRCFVSQSAVSQQIKALEEELNVQLLHRQGKGFTLTPAGERVLAAARDMAARADRMRIELDRLSDANRHELRVGYLNRYEGWEVQGAVAAFAVRHPQVAITATAGSHDDLYEMMLSGAIDVAFNDQRRELSDEFVNEYLMTCYTSIEVSEASPLAAFDEVPVSQLGEEACILIARGDQRGVERDYYRNVLNFPCPFIFADTLEEARMMVAGNRGFLPLESHATRHAAGSVIRRIPLVSASGPLKRDYYAFWLDTRSGWVVREFARMLKELLASR